MRIGRGDNRPGRRGLRRGFTLLEVMLAAAVLAGGLAIAMAAMGAAGRTLARVQARREALAVARHVLALRDAGEVIDGEQGDVAAGRVNYAWLLRVESVTADAAVVRCRVEWRDFGGEHEISQAALVSPQTGSGE